MPDSGAEFCDVDKTASPSSFVEYLKYLETRPSMLAYKKLLFAQLNRTKFQSILNLGCGAGSDLQALAGHLEENGSLLAMDLSFEMLSFCKTQFIKKESHKLFFLQGNGMQLPIREESIELIHIDRVLLHIPQANEVVSQCIKILKRNGVLIIGEPDWGTFIMASSYPDIDAKVKNFLFQETSSGYVARYIPEWLANGKMKMECIEPFTAVLNDYQEFSKMMMLDKLLLRAEELNYLSAQESKVWKQDLEERSLRRTFMCSYTNYIFKACKSILSN